MIAKHSLVLSTLLFSSNCSDTLATEKHNIITVSNDFASNTSFYFYNDLFVQRCNAQMFSLGHAYKQFSEALLANFASAHFTKKQSLGARACVCA
jgi:hypothetical protein